MKSESKQTAFRIRSNEETCIHTHGEYNTKITRNDIFHMNDIRLMKTLRAAVISLVVFFFSIQRNIRLDKNWIENNI